MGFVLPVYVFRNLSLSLSLKKKGLRKVLPVWFVSYDGGGVDNTSKLGVEDACGHASPDSSPVATIK